MCRLRRLKYVFAAVLVSTFMSQPAVGQKQETVRLPPVPARAVELDRSRTAPTWNSRFCSHWTDECTRCQKPVALENTAVCQPDKPRDVAACSPSPVRCTDFDPVLAPLFCVGVGDECGGWNIFTTGRGNEFGTASNDYCFGRKTRPPVNWVCGTPQSVRDRCAKEHTGYQSKQECVRMGLYAVRQYRRAMERLIRDSNRLEVR